MHTLKPPPPPDYATDAYCITSNNCLADDREEFVRRFQFTRSVWNMNRVFKLCSVASRLKRGLGMPQIEGDPLSDLYQLGGNVTVDHFGRILYIYRSQTTLDRPEIQDILDSVPEARAQQDNRSGKRSISGVCSII